MSWSALLAVLEPEVRPVVPVGEVAERLVGVEPEVKLVAVFALVLVPEGRVSLVE